MRAASADGCPQATRSRSRRTSSGNFADRPHACIQWQDRQENRGFSDRDRDRRDVHAHGSHGHSAGRLRRTDSDRAPPGQRPARGALRGPPDPGRGGVPLVRRRLAPRSQGSYRPCSPFRAPDVPGLRAGQGQRPLRAGPGRGRLAQRHHQFRAHQLLRDHADPPAGARPLAGGRPHGLAAGRPRRGVDGEPARRRQERAPAALRQRPLRHGVREADRPRLPGGPPLPPHPDRLDGRPGRGHPGGRARVLPHVLRAEQRRAVGRRRHRPGADARLGREVLRLHPRARRQARAARRLAARGHRRAAARGRRGGGPRARVDGRLPAPGGRHARVRRGRPGAHRPRRRRVLPPLQPAGTARPYGRGGRLRPAAAGRCALPGLAGREDLR